MIILGSNVLGAVSLTLHKKASLKSQERGPYSLIKRSLKPYA